MNFAFAPFLTSEHSSRSGATPPVAVSVNFAVPRRALMVALPIFTSSGAGVVPPPGFPVAPGPGPGCGVPVPGLPPGGAVAGANVAVTAVSPPSVSTHVPVPEQPPPLQPENVAPAAGDAVSVTVVPVG